MKRMLGCPRLAPAAILLVGALATAGSAAAQSFPSDDPVIRAIWHEGMDNSQLYRLGQALMDSIGPRLNGTPALKAGDDWLVKTYASWGIPAREEQYGTWKGWREGWLHVDLLQPRVRTLEAHLLGWSPGTNGPVQGDVVIFPDVKTPADFEAWLPQARGKFVLVSFAQPTCRPDSDWITNALPAEWQKLRQERAAADTAWLARLKAAGVTARELAPKLEAAGARGVLSNRWSDGWGVDKVFNAHAARIPEIDLSCEDYGLVFRLAQNSQHPVLRVDAQAQFLGDVPVFNTVAEIKGTEKPNEYVILSAHFDSWHAGSGATDNGTGTITMMEAARILKQVYPNPKRTILVGHWASEEQGLNGSAAFVEDHPDIVKGLQALFNQDNGTGRIMTVSASGFLGAGALLADWLERVPDDLKGELRFQVPGNPGGGGSDYASFDCAGAPGFSLGSLPWNYFLYTWHTNRDTFDKIVFDEVRRNAVLTAMLVYMAANDPRSTPRVQRIPGANPFTGRPSAGWPKCTPAQRDFSQYPR